MILKRCKSKSKKGEILRKVKTLKKKENNQTNTEKYKFN